MSTQTLRKKSIGYVGAWRHSAARFSYWCLAAAQRLAPYLVVLGMVMVALPSAQAANSATANSAESFVQMSIENGYTILNDSTLSAGERESRFRALLVSVVDFNRIAAFTIGPYARGATAADIDHFESAFVGFATSIYQRNLDLYAGQTIRVTGSMAHAVDDMIVTADIVPATAKEPPLKIAFRVRKTENGHNAIVDLQAEGVWLALTQRSEFTAYLQQHDGDIQRLAEELESRAQRVHSGASTAIRSVNSH